MELSSWQCLLWLLVMIQSVDAGVNRLTNTQSSSQDRSRRRQLSSVQSQVNQSQAIQVQGITRDAPYSVNRTAIESSVNCLNNTILGRSGGIIILVSGTGSTGNESFGAGPYTQLLPFLAPGFDVCLLDLPDRSQGDAQVTSEYIAGNIIPLAKKSRTGKVSLIGHSQGNLNIQWALNFWPSTRPFVHHYVSLAGDFRGTTSANLFCKIWGHTITYKSGNCTQAFFQQANNSSFVAALGHFGHQALVPTTSIYTKFDDVIYPEYGVNTTSVLPGAENIRLQDSNVCGSTHLTDHFTMVLDPAAFNLAYTSITKPPGTSLDNWDPSYCHGYIAKGTFGSLKAAVKNIPKYLKALVNDTLSVFTYDTSHNETRLMPYVCASGSAPAEKCE